MNLDALREPSLGKFLEFCDSFHKNALDISGKQYLEVYATVLSEKLIPAFGLDKRGRDGLCRLFGNPSGLACLISELKRARVSEVRCIWMVLGDILTKTNLKTMLHLAYTETSQLIWGSRVLNITSSRCNNEIREFAWLGDGKQYSSWLAQRMISDNIVDPKLFDRGLKLGAPAMFIQPFMKDIELLERLFTQLRRGQQEFLLTHGLLPELPKRPAKSAVMLLSLKVCPQMLAHICYKLPADVETIRAAIIVARELKALDSIVGDLLNIWSSKFFIETTPLINQQALTQYLIAASVSLTLSEATKHSHSPQLTEGVSKRLASTSNSIRELGTLAAETFAKRSGANLEFGLSYTGYPWWIGRDSLENTDLHAGCPDQTSDYDHKKMDQILEPLANLATDSDDEKKITVDSDDEESEEEVDPPYFLKDLIFYLRSDKYPEVLSALEHGQELVFRKSQLGSEVSHYAEELLLVTCGLSDKYSIKNFQDMRQGILNAILAADPNQVPVAMRMFVTGDWSLAQRQSLLVAVAYAAYILARGKQEPDQFQQLPSRLHALFVSSEDKGRLITDKPSNNDVERSVSNPSQKKNVKNHLSMVANLFFFPLLAAKPPLRKSSYDAIIFAQWLRTLGLVVAQSYPTQYISDMVSEMWPLLAGLLRQWPYHEHVVIEALYAAMSLILDVGKSIILRDYSAEIGTVFDLLIDSFAQVSQNGKLAEQSGRQAAAQLAEMIKQLNQRILGSN